MLPTIMGGWFDVGRWFECWAGHCRTHNPSSRCTHLWLQEMMIMMTLFMKSGCEWEIGILFTAARQTWSQREMFYWIRSSLPSFRVPTTSPIDFNVSFVAGLQNSLVVPERPPRLPRTGLQASESLHQRNFLSSKVPPAAATLWCGRADGGHFNGGWIILRAKTRPILSGEGLPLKSNRFQVHLPLSGQCNPEVDILRPICFGQTRQGHISAP